MKHLLAMAFLATFVACSNNDNKKEETSLTTKTIEQSNQSQTSPSVIEDSKPTVAEPHESVFPIGTYKTLSEIMKHVFSQGSTKNEVRMVQGEPDYIEVEPPLENWYYGTCIVQFKGQIVGGVKNTDSKLKYADYLALALSPDKIETEFCNLLNSRINR